MARSGGGNSQGRRSERSRSPDRPLHATTPPRFGSDRSRTSGSGGRWPGAASSVGGRQGSGRPPWYAHAPLQAPPAVGDRMGSGQEGRGHRLRTTRARCHCRVLSYASSLSPTDSSRNPSEVGSAPSQDAQTTRCNLGALRTLASISGIGRRSLTSASRNSYNVAGEVVILAAFRRSTRTPVRSATRHFEFCLAVALHVR